MNRVKVRALGARVSERGRRTGLALLQLAILLPLLFLLLFGVIDFGRLLLAKNEIAALSREGGNLASRGTPFDQTIRAIFSASGSSDLNQNGCIILTAVERGPGGHPVVTEQQVAGHHPRPSRVGSLGNPATVPVPQLPRPGKVLVVAEVYMNYSAVTPIASFLGQGMPAFAYDSAYFY